ncbi:serine/threonine protein kinase [Tautonia rosea]|uniref:serine/threonine protein kinase n=1 Tax=Tautonia rosea TaxID=2728037 RepID=UPI00147412B5|nr:serine/threonine-protein kinase [Tautonia rosea]
MLSDFSNLQPDSASDSDDQIVERLKRLEQGRVRSLDSGPDPSTLLNHPKVDGYRIERLLGRGGAGVVYSAWDTTLHRMVAIKCLRPDRVESEGGEALVREARASALLRHDHLVPIHGLGRLENGGLFLVMPLIEGRSLRRLVQGESCLSPRRAADYVRQVADALAAVHAAGMVHRDVKSGNILIDENDGRAKLGDFGLARLTVSSELSTADGSRLLGTPEYLCPESLNDAKALNDPRADVYSLGVTLYECLTGTVPFHGLPHRVLHQVAHHEPKPARELNDDIPRDLETICSKAMTIDRDKRYQTAAAFRDDLGRWLSGQPILARPSTRLERWNRWVRRRPWQAATLGTGAALLVAATGASISLQRAAHEISQTNTALMISRAESEKAFQLSQDALSRVVDRVSEKLFEVPNATAVMLESMEDAAALHQQLVALRPDDRDAAERYGAALSSLCTVQFLNGLIPEAEQTCERYRRHVESTRAKQPDDLTVGLRYIDLLQTRETLSIKLGRIEEARQTTALYRAEAQRLARLYPASAELVATECRILMGVLIENRREKNYQEALEVAAELLPALERWRELQPDEADPVNTLGFSLVLKARCLEALGHYDEALQAVAKAESVYQSPELRDLPKRDQDWNEIQVLKIRSRITLASNSEEAESHLLRQEQALRHQIRLYPEDALREDLVLTLIDLGKLLTQSNTSRAKEIFEESRNQAQQLIADVPEVDRYRELLRSIESILAE